MTQHINIDFLETLDDHKVISTFIYNNVTNNDDVINKNDIILSVNDDYFTIND